MDNYRHEIKYICTVSELEELKIKLSAVAEPDRHAKNGSYRIRSIYFDDHYNSSYFDNESGVDPREKWRIRIYDNDESLILLECKRKMRGMINKKQVRLSREEYDRIVRGDIELKFDDRNILNRFYCLMETRLLRPVVIVQYTRFPFICFEGNVRITLDCDISSSVDYDHFFDRDICLRPIQERDQQLLEIKYDEFLPDEIYHAIHLKNRQQQTFSKYYLCRSIGMGA